MVEERLPAMCELIAGPKVRLWSASSVELDRGAGIHHVYLQMPFIFEEV